MPHSKSDTLQQTTLISVSSILLLTLLSLSGCGISPQNTRPDSNGSVQRWQQLIEDGHYQQAAEAFVIYTQQQTEEMHVANLLEATQLWIAHQQWDLAASFLRQISSDDLENYQRAHVDILWAEVALNQGAIQRALALLTFSPNRLDSYWRIKYHQLQADTLYAAGNYLLSAQQRLTLQTWLDDDLSLHSNALRIYDDLRKLSAEELANLIVKYRSDHELRGWLSLVYRIKQSLFNNDNIDQIVFDWKMQFPDHLAQQLLEELLIKNTGKYIEKPERIGVILPASGRFAAAATAVRNGILAAYFQQQGAKPKLRFYDSGENYQSSINAYRAAENDGATWIIGPLDKEIITQMRDRYALSVPLLALNEAEPILQDPLPFNLNSTENSQADNLAPLFQFALRPEAEVRQIAHLARKSGLNRALILSPFGERGDKLRAAFIQNFEAQGGVVVGSNRYRDNESDHGASIRQLLQISRSEQRHRKLTALLRRKMEFEPRVRDDADIIFLAASPEQARVIQPQFRFHRAGNIPVFSISQAYSGTINQSADSDLNQLSFCDAPWLLDRVSGYPKHEDIVSFFPEITGSAARLFALGMDSYILLPYLQWLKDQPEDILPGATGILTVGSDGTVNRALSCARIINGMPVLLTQIPTS